MGENPSEEMNAGSLVRVRFMTGTLPTKESVLLVMRAGTQPHREDSERSHTCAPTSIVYIVVDIVLIVDEYIILYWVLIGCDTV